MVQASESPSRRSMTRRPGSGFRDTRPHGQRRGHRRVTSCRVIRCAIPQCRTPNLCSARRLPGHPCESDGSGSAGQRRASLCAPRPRVPRRPYPCWSALRCCRAYRPFASGAHRGNPTLSAIEPGTQAAPRPAAPLVERGDTGCYLASGPLARIKCASPTGTTRARLLCP
jgi:hypothetical protein